MPESGGTQVSTREYVIIKNSKSIGTILFTENKSGGNTILLLETEINARFLISFEGVGREEAVFQNNNLIRSSIYRKLNGTEKANKRLWRGDSSYLFRDGSDSGVATDRPIHYHLLSLYIKEPVDDHWVFSDNFQQFVEVERLSGGHYKIRFPDGNANEYFYQQGICSKILVHHTFYSATIQLK
jgi:hypothetical protein